MVFPLSVEPCNHALSVVGPSLNQKPSRWASRSPLVQREVWRFFAGYWADRIGYPCSPRLRLGRCSAGVFVEERVGKLVAFASTAALDGS